MFLGDKGIVWYKNLCYMSMEFISKTYMHVWGNDPQHRPCIGNICHVTSKMWCHILRFSTPRMVLTTQVMLEDEHPKLQSITCGVQVIPASTLRP